jgi:hypothetical protein
MGKVHVSSLVIEVLCTQVSCPRCRCRSQIMTGEALSFSVVVPVYSISNGR